MGIKCDGGWRSDVLGVTLFASTTKLSSRTIQELTLGELKRELSDLYASHLEIFKDMVKNVNPISEHAGGRLVLDVEAQYEESGTELVEFRKFFLMIPFCRVDFYMVSNSKRMKRLTESRDSAERNRLKEELARMTFGD
jgi:hypothetical protein